MIDEAEEVGVAVAVLSAASQAAVHMVWKSAGDKLVIRAIIGSVESLVMLPFALYVALPTQALWIWLAVSVCIHLIYQLVLIEAYKSLDFSVAYPLARGMAPIATAVLGIALLGDRVGPAALLGIVCVSAGLITISLGARPHRSGLLAALVAGLLTTAYSLVDAQGMRLAANMWTFVVWFFVLDGVGILIIAIGMRGRRLPGLMQAEGKRALVGSAISLGGYTAALVAFRLISVGAATALRETSVAFATLFAKLFLGERIPYRRYLGVTLIVIGSGLIALFL